MVGRLSVGGGDILPLPLLLPVLFPLFLNDALTTVGVGWEPVSSKLPFLLLLRPFRRDLIPGIAVSKGSANLERDGRRLFALYPALVGDACGTVKDGVVVVLVVVTIRRPRVSSKVACSATFPVIK